MESRRSGLGGPGSRLAARCRAGSGTARTRGRERMVSSRTAPLTTCGRDKTRSTPISHSITPESISQSPPTAHASSTLRIEAAACDSQATGPGTRQITAASRSGRVDAESTGSLGRRAMPWRCYGMGPPCRQQARYRLRPNPPTLSTAETFVVATDASRCRAQRQGHSQGWGYGARQRQELYAKQQQ